MDPVSQGALGAAFAQSLNKILNKTSLQTNSASQGDLSQRENLVVASWLGCAAGMAPDLDVLIQSSTDPLLFLEFHRHFTHSLIFIPIGALIVALALFPLARHKISFLQAYLVCLIGYATHGLLDACTTYGTQLFWPFSNYRVSWNNVSVVDPVFTIPLVIIVIAAARSKKYGYTYVGMAWVFLYLTFGAVQMQRALADAHKLALIRGHVPTQLSVKPSIANLLVWKSIYAHDNHYYVDAVRTGTSVTICPGGVVEKLDVAKHLPGLQQNTQQHTDLERFRWFSQDYLAPTGIPGEVTDMRYSSVPNQIEPMWGISIASSATAEQHVQWWTRREVDQASQEAFWRLLTGEDCRPISDISHN